MIPRRRLLLLVVPTLGLIAAQRTVAEPPAARLGTVTFVVTTDQPRYIPGDTITLTLTATNAGTKPAVLALPIWDGGLSSSVGISVIDSRTHKPLPINFGTPYAAGKPQALAQVMVHGQISPDRFLVLKPGERRDLYATSFRAHYLPGNQRPHLKSDLAAASRNEPPFQTGPLPSGTYQIKATYQWDRSPEAIKKHFLGPPQSLTFTDPTAKTQFYTSLTGKAQTQTTLLVGSAR